MTAGTSAGAQVIEAHYLFGASYDDIQIVIHPQSIIHSMVETQDSSVLAQLGWPDMRLPILYTMSWPERVPCSEVTWPRLDFTKMGDLTFRDPDHAKYPAMDLAYAAGRTGGTMTGVLSAANEQVRQCWRGVRACGVEQGDTAWRLCCGALMFTVLARRLSGFLIACLHDGDVFDRPDRRWRCSWTSTSNTAILSKLWRPPVKHISRTLCCSPRFRCPAFLLDLSCARLIVDVQLCEVCVVDLFIQRKQGVSYYCLRTKRQTLASDRLPLHMWAGPEIGSPVQGLLIQFRPWISRPHLCRLCSCRILLTQMHGHAFTSKNLWSGSHALVLSLQLTKR